MYRSREEEPVLENGLDRFPTPWNRNGRRSLPAASREEAGEATQVHLEPWHNKARQSKPKRIGVDDTAPTELGGTHPKWQPGQPRCPGRPGEASARRSRFLWHLPTIRIYLRSSAKPSRARRIPPDTARQSGFEKAPVTTSHATTPETLKQDAMTKPRVSPARSHHVGPDEARGKYQNTSTSPGSPASSRQTCWQRICGSVSRTAYPKYDRSPGYCARRPSARFLLKPAVSTDPHLTTFPTRHERIHCLLHEAGESKPVETLLRKVDLLDKNRLIQLRAKQEALNLSQGTVKILAHFPTVP